MGGVCCADAVLVLLDVGGYSRVLLAGLALAVSPARLRNVDHFSIVAKECDESRSRW